MFTVLESQISSESILCQTKINNDIFVVYLPPEYISTTPIIIRSSGC